MKRSSKADALLEALPYFQQFRGRTVVVKYGGAAMENPDLVESVMHDIVFLEAVGINPVVVHGGGKAITAAMRQENITARFVDGFRYTDEPSMKIIDRVLTEVISPSAKLRCFPARKCSSPPRRRCTPIPPAPRLT
jgi:acetylglutamate kinase